MHPTDVDPGVTLAGRYRVAELLAEAPGDGGVAQTWRAVDEVLSRSVVVHVLSADDERAPVLLDASRRAATVSDARFIRVLDAMEEDGVAYVVREWVQGRSLAKLLVDGPLPPRNAGLLVREVAEALASAHLQGLTHERLDLDSVVVTDSGSIKIVGLATQSALTADGGEPATDPSHADALGLGRLLYAGLTGRSPSGPRSGLEAAVRGPDGTLLSPRQCLAGIPKGLDEITERILSENPRHGTPLDSPDQVAMALIEAVGITPPEGVLPAMAQHRPGDPIGEYAPPVARPPAHYAASGGYPPPDDDRTQAFQRPPQPPYAAHGGPPGPPPQRPPQPYRRQRPSRWRRAVTLLVGLVLFAGLILLGWQLTQGAFQLNPNAGDSTDTPTEEEPTPKTPDRPEKPYKISAGGDFDPESQGGNGEEYPENVPLTYDGDENTQWTTYEYYDPMDVQGKNGVGFWVDLGKPVEVGSVELTSLLGQGTDLELYTAPQNATAAPTELEGWTRFSQANDVGSSDKLTVEEPVQTRFVLVWITELPPDDESFRGGVGEIVVRP